MLGLDRPAAKNNMPIPKSAAFENALRCCQKCCLCPAMFSCKSALDFVAASTIGWRHLRIVIHELLLNFYMQAVRTDQHDFDMDTSLFPQTVYCEGFLILNVSALVLDGASAFLMVLFPKQFTDGLLNSSLALHLSPNLAGGRRSGCLSSLVSLHCY